MFLPNSLQFNVYYLLDISLYQQLFMYYIIACFDWKFIEAPTYYTYYVLVYGSKEKAERPSCWSERPLPPTSSSPWYGVEASKVQFPCRPRLQCYTVVTKGQSVLERRWRRRWSPWRMATVAMKTGLTTRGEGRTSSAAQSSSSASSLALSCSPPPSTRGSGTGKEIVKWTDLHQRLLSQVLLRPGGRVWITTAPGLLLSKVRYLIYTFFDKTRNNAFPHLITNSNSDVTQHRLCPHCKEDVPSQEFIVHKAECNRKERDRFATLPIEGDVRCPLCDQVRY